MLQHTKLKTAIGFSWIFKTECSGSNFEFESWMRKMPSCRYLFYMEAQCQHFEPGVSGSQSMIAVKLYSKFPNIEWFRVNELCFSLLKWGRRPCKKEGQSDQWLSPNRNLPRKLLNVMDTSSKLRIKINQVLRQIPQGFHSFICEGNFNTSGPEKIQTVTVSLEISAQTKWNPTISMPIVSHTVKQMILTGSKQVTCSTPFCNRVHCSDHVFNLATRQY